MKQLSVFLFFFLSTHILPGQDSLFTRLQDGVYSTREDFISRNVVLIPKMRKLNLRVPVSHAFKDTLVDHCIFLNGKNDQIKKIFAVVHQGQLYFSGLACKVYMPLEYSTMGLSKDNEFHRVLEWGKYLYLEVTYKAKDPGAMIVMGAMFGVVGALAGSAMEPNEEIATPIIYDISENVFYGLHTRKQIQEFMDSHHPEMKFDSKASDLNIETLKILIRHLNTSS